MGKLTRALGAVALLDLALVIAGIAIVLTSPRVAPTGVSFSYSLVEPLFPFPSSAAQSSGLMDQVSQFFLTAWPPLSYLVPLLLSVFALIAAASARRWGWLAAFLIVGAVTLLAPVALVAHYPLFILVARPGAVDGYSLWSFIIPALAPLLALACVVSAWRGHTARAAHDPDGLTRSALAH